MSGRTSRKRRHFETSTDNDEMLVGHVLGHLDGLAKLQSQEKTGNEAFGTALLHLVDALRPYANSPVADLSLLLGKSPPKINSAVSRRKHGKALPTELESLELEIVEQILADAGYTKKQLAELGFRRFGISQSYLTRVPKTDALASIRAALDNERTLDVIEEQASRAGQARSGVALASQD